MTADAMAGAAATARKASARYFVRASLAARLSVAFLGLVAFVLIVNGAIDTYLTYGQAKRAALEVEAEKARGAAERVNAFLSEIQTQIGWTAGAEWGYAKPESQRYDFIRLLKQAPAITALAYIDKSGKELLSVSRLEPDAVASGKDYSEQPMFQRAVADKVWFGPVEFRRGSEPHMTIAVAHVGKTPGVTVAEVNLKLIWDVVSEIHVGEKGFAYVVDDNGRLIAHPDLSLVLRDSDFSKLPQVAAALAAQRSSEVAPAGGSQVARSLEGASVLTAYAIAAKTHWAVFVEQPLDEALAGGFHRMAGQLQESYETLEAKVEARTKDLNEALAQQTATANVLKVISRSVFDLDTVLQTLIDTAVQLTHGSRGTIFLRQGDLLVARAFHSNVNPELRAFLSSTTWRLDGDSQMARAARERAVVHIPDLSKSALATDKEVQKRASFGAGLWTPLMREGEVIGVFGVPRDEPVAFSTREIELVQTFADQAVIAIENTRLFEEVQAKTRDLAEALVHQTASGNILKVIASSPTTVAPALQAIVDSACEVCGAYDAAVNLREGDRVRFSAHRGPIPIGLESWPLSRSWVGGRAIVDGAPVHVHDLQLAGDEFPDGRDFALAMGHRTILAAPLLRDGESIGAIVVRRTEAHPFTHKQIELLRSFADQAVIAIENVRLFNETQEALAQQTATADVLKTISRSAFDLQAVLDTLIGSAVTMTGADSGLIYLQREAAFFVQAHYDPSSEPAFFEMLRRRPQGPGRGSVGGRVLLTGETQQVPDISLDPDYDPGLRAATVSKALLGVALKRDGTVIGAVVLARRTPGPFAPRQIELAETFADQAVIAVENARLLEEVQARTRDLEQSLADLHRTQDRLVQSEKLASLGQLTAGIAHEIKNPLNFVNNFASLSRELLEELREALAPLPDDARSEADDLIGMIGSNLEKVVSHGKRADSIVKNMLLHSREGSGERTRVNVNAMMEEALNLGYHGARAEKPGFNVTLEKSFDPDAGDAELYLQEVTRVLLNLISNGFYATDKRRQAEGPDYQPTLTATTRDLGHSVEIRIRDNGVGIPEEVRAKMFNPFFTTKPAGEGTGLGLSLSHDIVVKQHGGSIEVETAPGAFTEFIVTLPREGART